MKSFPPAVVLAGGLGTRLTTVIGQIPKVLSPFFGRTFLDWKIANLAHHGVSEIYLLVGYGSQHVKEHLRFSSYPVAVTCIDEGPNPLGTARALMQAIDYLITDQFILTYGDNILHQPLGEMLRSSFPKEDSLMCVTKKGADQTAYNSKLHGKRVVAHSKRMKNCAFDCLDYGYSILGKDHFQAHSRQEDVDLSEVFGRMAESNTLWAYETDSPFWEIGTPQSYQSSAKSVQLRNYIGQLEQTYDKKVGR